MGKARELLLSMGYDAATYDALVRGDLPDGQIDIGILTQAENDSNRVLTSTANRDMMEQTGRR